MDGVKAAIPTVPSTQTHQAIRSLHDRRSFPTRRRACQAASSPGGCGRLGRGRRNTSSREAGGCVGCSRLRRLRRWLRSTAKRRAARAFPLGAVEHVALAGYCSPRVSFRTLYNSTPHSSRAAAASFVISRGRLKAQSINWTVLCRLLCSVGSEPVHQGSLSGFLI